MFRLASLRRLGKLKTLSFVGGLVLGVTTYRTYENIKFLIPDLIKNSHVRTLSYIVQCAQKNNVPQELVVGADKNYALFLTIYLKPNSPTSGVINALGKLKASIDRISPVDIRDEDNEILMNIGFGPSTLSRIYPSAVKNGVKSFAYKERTYTKGTFPTTGGDIFIHASCSEYGKLFELAKVVISELPTSSVADVDEIYGFKYRGGRDLSGFIDGTENPADEEDRFELAVDKRTAGSYMITQKWLHDVHLLDRTTVTEQEQWIGRTKEDSLELKPVVPASHVGRMTHGLSAKLADERRIVRHSFPYGTVTGGSGLFFIAYSRSPETFDWMLDRMAGATADRTQDSILNFTRPLTGAYWYVPSVSELETILSSAKRR